MREGRGRRVEGRRQDPREASVRVVQGGRGRRAREAEGGV